MSGRQQQGHGVPRHGTLPRCKQHLYHRFIREAILRQLCSFFEHRSNHNLLRQQSTHLQDTDPLNYRYLYFSFGRRFSVYPGLDPQHDTFSDLEQNFSASLVPPFNWSLNSGQFDEAFRGSLDAIFVVVMFSLVHPVLFFSYVVAHLVLTIEFLRFC